MVQGTNNLKGSGTDDREQAGGGAAVLMQLHARRPHSAFALVGIP